MNAWRLSGTGHPVGAYPCPCDPADLTTAQRDELTEVLRAHQDQWLITGPCPDGSWYAISRHDNSRPCPSAATLSDLDRTLTGQHSQTPPPPSP